MFAVVMSPVFYSCRENHVCNNFAFSFQNHIRTFITFPITLVHRKLRFSREPRGKLECVCLADKCSIEWRWANYKIHSLRSSENEEARNLCLKFLRCECLPRNRNRMWLKIVNIFWLRYVIWIRIYNKQNCFEKLIFLVKCNQLIYHFTCDQVWFDCKFRRWINKQWV